MLSAFFFRPTPFSHLFPVMNLLPFENLFMVRRQLFVHPLHLVMELSYVSFLISSIGSMVVTNPSLYLFLAMRAAPKAPMIPEMSGLIAVLPDMTSKLFKTASL